MWNNITSSLGQPNFCSKQVENISYEKALIKDSAELVFSRLSVSHSNSFLSYPLTGAVIHTFLSATALQDISKLSLTFSRGYGEQKVVY